MWELYLTYLRPCAKSVMERKKKKNMSKGNPRGRVHRRGEWLSEGEKCELARRREGEKETSLKEEECEGESTAGIRKSSSQQSVRARYVWNGVSLYRAQCVCVNSLLCLSLEELSLPIPIGTMHSFLPCYTPQIPRLLCQLCQYRNTLPAC